MEKMMAQQPKRIPGERNPRSDADAPMHVVRDGWMGNGRDYGIARGINALLDWRRDRKARKRRS
jgi:hypothetical protein